MGSTRREFVRLAAGAAAVPGLRQLAAQTDQPASETSASRSDLEFRSPLLRVQMAVNQPGFLALTLDSLGKSKLDGNVMLPLDNPAPTLKAARENQTITYALANADNAPVWTFEFTERSILIRSTYSPKSSQPLVLSFTIDSHATLLGLLTDYGAMRLPALLHFPHRGTFRVTTATSRMTLGYDASRSGDKFVRVSFPAANAGQKQSSTTWTSSISIPSPAERPSRPTPGTTATAGISSPCFRSTLAAVSSPTTARAMHALSPSSSTR